MSVSRSTTAFNKFGWIKDVRKSTDKFYTTSLLVPHLSTRALLGCRHTIEGGCDKEVGCWQQRKFRAPHYLRELPKIQKRNFYTFSSIKTKFGWLKDRRSLADKIYIPILKKFRAIPESVDLDEHYKLPIVYNQGRLGSCVANSVAFAYKFCDHRCGSTFEPSRLFIYYNARMMEGTTDEDCGCQIRDGIESLNKYGVCREDLWRYNVSQFCIKPTDNCYVDASQNKIILYRRVRQQLDVLRCAILEFFRWCLVCIFMTTLT